MWKQIGDFIERWVRAFIIFITNYLPVKVIRDDQGVPFLYRYHIFALTNDGPGICLHHFVKSDERGQFHNHPWSKSLSLILCGGYEEEILKENKREYFTINRPRFTFNYLDGIKTYHRVMIQDNRDAWTLFFFRKRNKVWGMYNLQGEYKPMSTQVSDLDGDWPQKNIRGLGIHSHLEHPGKVIATVDIVIIAENKVLLIKRGKEPFKGCWALPGGRIEQKDNDILAAAIRELKEETKLTDIPLTYYKTIGNNKRDVRGFCLTNIFVAKLDKLPTNVRAGDDAVDYTWFNIYDLPTTDLAFDHKEILYDILKSMFNL